MLQNILQLHPPKNNVIFKAPLPLGVNRLLVITAFTDDDLFHCHSAVDEGIAINCKNDLSAASQQCVSSVLVSPEPFTVAPEKKKNIPLVLWGCLGFMALMQCSIVWISSPSACVFLGHTSTLPRSAVPLFGLSSRAYCR